MRMLISRPLYLFAGVLVPLAITLFCLSPILLFALPIGAYLLLEGEFSALACAYVLLTAYVWLVPYAGIRLVESGRLRHGFFAAYMIAYAAVFALLYLII